MFLIGEGKNGAATYELVTEYPIYLRSVHVDELDAARHGYLFRTKKPTEKWRSVVVTAREAIGKDATSAMAEKGVTVHDGEAWKMFVRASVDHYHKERDVETRYDQFGWKHNESAFLVGTRLYTTTSVTEVSGSPTLEQRSVFLRPSQAKGASLDRWRRAANKMFAEGLEHQSLALLCGFAAPLMRFHSEGEGGAIVSFVSDKTSSGKTTALEAAASIWGQPRGLKLDETDTRVAKGLKLGLLGNLPCTFDELHERDPELIRQFVITFTNGADKDRGTSDGGLKVNKADWQTILLIASNTSIVDKLSNHDASDAPAARVLEFNTRLPPHMGQDDFDHIRRELMVNCGFAGDEYIRHLVQPEVTDWIRANIPGWVANVRRAGDLSEKHRFWTRLIVSIIAAGTIVERYGILDFSMKRMTAWLINEANKQRNRVTVNTETDAIEQLGWFINEHVKNTLCVTDSFRSGARSAVRMAPSGPLIARYETEPKRLMISESNLKRWLVKKGINIQGFTTQLKVQNVLVGEVRKFTLGAGTDFASGQTACFTINMAHPLISGALTSVEEAFPEKPEEVKPQTRADRIRQFGG